MNLHYNLNASRLIDNDVAHAKINLIA
jgi:hypothetical protein